MAAWLKRELNDQMHFNGLARRLPELPRSFSSSRTRWQRGFGGTKGRHEGRLARLRGALNSRRYCKAKFGQLPGYHFYSFRRQVLVAPIVDAQAAVPERQ